MSVLPPELNRLLAGEIARRLRLLSDPNTPELDLRGALHTLKGSAAMAGHTELALVIAQSSQRVQAKEPTAIADTRLLLEHALARLMRDLAPFSSVWPEPPPFLGPSSIDSKYRTEYCAAIRDRLEELDRLQGESSDALRSLEHAQRNVHAMKGAAAALGDDVSAWYCHGVEAALRSVPREPAAAAAAIVDLAQHRAIITLLLDDQPRALETLRASAKRRPAAPTPEPTVLRRPASRPPSGEFQAHAAPDLKVSLRALDAFSERIERIDLVYEELLRAGDLARKQASRLRETGLGLNEARRQIDASYGSDPKPAALARIDMASLLLRTSAANAERGAGIFRRNAEFLRSRTTEMRSEISALRRTSLHTLFERVKRATLRDAVHEGKAVEVEIVGRDVPIDQRIAERLLETVLQLARNALVHGIEAPQARVASSKPERGRITLSAQQTGEWLRITVADDGRGADVQHIRELAVAAGAVSREAATCAGEDELLALLFLPGLTTRRRADLLAGRGLGLDLVQDTVRRLGGTIRLRSREGGGLSASFEMPSDRTVVDVLWLEEMGQRFALPVSFTGRVEPLDASSGRPVRLARCLGQHSPRDATVSLELTVYGIAPIHVSLDAVGEIEQVALRALPELIAERGPYGAAVLQSDGTLRLALDAPLVAARAWTLRATGAA